MPSKSLTGAQHETGSKAGDAVYFFAAALLPHVDTNRDILLVQQRVRGGLRPFSRRRRLPENTFVKGGIERDVRAWPNLIIGISSIRWLPGRT